LGRRYFPIRGRGILSVLFFSWLVFGPDTLPAHGYPKQPINLIIPLAPGDATDVAGRTTMRGIVASTKMPEFPQIPTLTQLGYKQNLLGVWSAFFAPAGVPAEVSKTLIAALEKVVKDPAVASKLGNLGKVADYVPPDKLIAEIREEHRTVEQIAKKTGLIK
jgi:tripartite-type tricarboxylate transporter receptor subunit TctC